MVGVLHYIFIHGERIGTSHLMVVTVITLIVVMSALCGKSKSFRFRH